MSDLHDIIATTTIRAFQQGQAEERRKMLTLIEGYGAGSCQNNRCDCINIQSLLLWLKGDSNGEAQR
jgi:hypothetical protein